MNRYCSSSADFRRNLLVILSHLCNMLAVAFMGLVLEDTRLWGYESASIAPSLGDQ